MKNNKNLHSYANVLKTFGKKNKTYDMCYATVDKCGNISQSKEETGEASG